MVHLINAALSAEADERVSHTARLFGIGKVGKKVKDRLQGILAWAIQDGALRRDGSLVFPADEGASAG